VAKADEQLTKRDMLSAHAAIFESNAYEPLDPKFIFTHLPGFGDNAVIRGDNAGLSWTRAASAGFTNEARIGFNRRHTEYRQQGSDQPLAACPSAFPRFPRIPSTLGSRISWSPASTASVLRWCCRRITRRTLLSTRL
jgi:hypothetical protein